MKVYLGRGDLIHPFISGNKWWKLKYNIAAAKELNHDTLLTFGGAYSNHIHAVAIAGREFGFKTIGVIRGEEIRELNPTLKSAQESGMQLYYIDRSSYREKNTSAIHKFLKEKFGDFYLIPEGGTNSLALKGCEEMIKTIDINYNYIAVPCGTGGTLAGIASGLSEKKQALGFSVLKGESFLDGDIQSLIGDYKHKILSNWSINFDYHFGGYAKYNDTLIDFINDFKREHHIQLDPIYTGKMMYGLFDLINGGHFSPSTHILAIHTGGLQGILGFNQRYGNLIL